MPSSVPPHTDPAVYKTILESTHAIPWSADWATKRFTYVGPQIESLLGWKASDWQTLEHWSDRIAEEDRDYVVDFCVSYSQKGLDHQAEYRALTSSGDYVWVRDLVHVVIRDERVVALTGFILDVSYPPTQRAMLETHPDTRARFTDLSNQFSFTKAESELALALVKGTTPKSYAHTKGISINTVRSQIRALLEKSGVRRQADLILLLMNGH